MSGVNEVVEEDEKPKQKHLALPNTVKGNTQNGDDDDDDVVLLAEIVLPKRPQSISNRTGLEQKPHLCCISSVAGKAPVEDDHISVEVVWWKCTQLSCTLTFPNKPDLHQHLADSHRIFPFQCRALACREQFKTQLDCHDKVKCYDTKF